MRPRTRKDDGALVPAPAAGQHDWYKDAVIYQVHVRAFLDSTADGIGDFVGLRRKLDYIQSLGVSAIWLLPFYPSPWRDDGYDIARYQDVHASYGTKRDFKNFLDDAHDRGLKVITELVINHTSDQHPWFQAARRAKPGSSKRNFYVWSDTPDKYAGVPIVFKDTEPSNWTWDPVAGAYFWHRFFHHQPDLNFDNPLVRKAVLKVMRFWLDMGVDGMRLDAVPYLVEREGTECANLPETHAILREIRADLDARYRGRMLLAEANQWPADVRSYFGDGDECHMAFHFPLMPRLYMALRQEDRHPISEILYQTPEIPESCQWALFLRNHDELTLEMVSDEERDYMYQTYATDPQMRLNAGIRRRLAPLLENNRARIELLNGLLLSLPGTPVLYYGDEIGMGDNVYLGDRNGVRTPMQWNADRNGGFSTADPARLYAPPIMDPVYGYQAVNVEAQERSPHSLLNWMRRMLSLRREHVTFGRGSIELLRPLNRTIFAFIRRLGTHDPILVVANLSKTVQPVTLDLGSLAGLVPVEMAGHVELPPITSAPYFLTLGPYAFMWLLLKRTSSAVDQHHDAIAIEAAERAPLLIGPDWGHMLDGSVRQLLERRYLPAFLSRQPWVTEWPGAAAIVRITDWVTLASGEEPVLLAIVTVGQSDHEPARYALPLVMAPGERGERVWHESPELVVAHIGGARKGVLHARVDGANGKALIRAIMRAGATATARGTLTGTRFAAFADAAPADDVSAWPTQPFDLERFHSAASFGERAMLSLPRRFWPGPSPEQQLARAVLDRTTFTRIPVPLARLDYTGADGSTGPVTLLETFIPHQADGWKYLRGEIDHFIETALTLPDPPGVSGDPGAWWSLAVPDAARGLMAPSITTMELLGRRLAELHRALAESAQAAGLETPLLGDTETAALLEDAARTWKQAVDQLSMNPSSSQNAGVTEVFGGIQHASQPRSMLIPVHGDFDLSQVLVHEGDFTIIGLAGRRDVPPSERLRPKPAFVDVASMLVSVHEAAEAALDAQAIHVATQLEQLRGWMRAWSAWASASLLAGYRSAATGAPFVPTDEASVVNLLRALVLTRAAAAVRDSARGPASTLARAAAVLRNLVIDVPGAR